MLNEVKHPVCEREVRSASEETAHAIPRSFAALRMTESMPGVASCASVVPTKFGRTRFHHARDDHADFFAEFWFFSLHFDFYQI